MSAGHQAASASGHQGFVGSGHQAFGRRSEAEADHLYALIANDNTIAKFTLSLNQVKLVANPISDSFLEKIAVNGDHVYILTQDGVIVKMNAQLNHQWTEMPGIDRLPIPPAVDANGNLFVGLGNDEIWSYAPDGTIRWKYQKSTSGWNPHQVASRSDGSVAVTYEEDAGAGVLVLSAAGNLVWDVTKTPYFARMDGVTVDQENNVIVEFEESSGGFNELIKYDSDGNEIWSFFGPGQPVADDEGAIYLANNTETVQKYDANGKFVWESKSAGDFYEHLVVATTRQPIVEHVDDLGNSEIVKFSSDGQSWVSQSGTVDFVADMAIQPGTVGSGVW